MNYKDFCLKQAENILSIIESDSSLAKWRKTWRSRKCIGGRLPHSANGYYSGINLLTLMFEQDRHGYTSGQWLTFNAIKKLGYCVKAGSKGVGVIYWSPKEMKDKETGLIKKTLLMRNYYVFNLDQTNIPADVQQTMADTFFDTMKAFNLSNFALDLRHEGDKAFYNPSIDYINMPIRTSFESDGEYMSTFLHELTHWTGHKSRITRECADNYGFDKKARATEELIAELGSVFLSAHYGIESDVKNHASYVASWKQHCTVDDIAIAIKFATKAFKLIVDTSDGKLANVELETDMAA